MNCREELQFYLIKRTCHGIVKISLSGTSSFEIRILNPNPPSRDLMIFSKSTLSLLQKEKGQDQEWLCFNLSLI